MRLPAITVLILLATAAPAAADSFAVDRTDDSAAATACTAAANDCSLRGALTDAAGTAGADTITLPAGRIVLTSALPDASSTAIIGTGARTTTLDGGGVVGIVIQGTPLTLQDLTVTGAAGDNFEDAAIEGQANLERVAVVGNDETGVLVGTGVMADSLVAGNHGALQGGVLVAAGVVRDSTITGNGGGFGTVPVTFTGGLSGEGIGAVENSTIAENFAAPGSGLIGGSQLAMGPDADGLITPLAVSSTIVDGVGQSGRACGSPIQSSGHNVASDDTCNFTEPSDRASVDPLLGPLADNGGPTDTMALLAGSPAIDNGAGCTTDDQRGITRAQGRACDSGAFESAFTAPPAPAPAPPPPPTTTTTVTVTTPAPPPPVDTTPAKLTLSTLPATTTRAKLARGIKLTVTATRPIVGDATLLVAHTRTGMPTTELAATPLVPATTRRTVTLHLTGSVPGRGRVAAVVRVVAFDLAGHRVTRTLSFAIS